MSTPDNKAAEQQSEMVREAYTDAQGAREASLQELNAVGRPALERLQELISAGPQALMELMSAARGQTYAQTAGQMQQFSENESRTGASQGRQRRQLQAATGQGIANLEAQYGYQGRRDQVADETQMANLWNQFVDQASKYRFQPSAVGVQGANALSSSVAAEAQQPSMLGSILAPLSLLAGAAMPSLLPLLLGGGTAVATLPSVLQTPAGWTGATPVTSGFGSDIRLGPIWNT